MHHGGGPVYVHGHKIQILLDGKDITPQSVADVEQDVIHGTTLGFKIQIPSTTYPHVSAGYYHSFPTKAKLSPGEFLFSKDDAAAMYVESEKFLEEWGWPSNPPDPESEADRMERIAKKMIEKQKAKAEEENW
jgi:hypothetical protein